MHDSQLLCHYGTDKRLLDLAAVFPAENGCLLLNALGGNQFVIKGHYSRGYGRQDNDKVTNNPYGNMWLCSVGYRPLYISPFLVPNWLCGGYIFVLMLQKSDQLYNSWLEMWKWQVSGDVSSTPASQHAGNIHYHYPFSLLFRNLYFHALLQLVGRAKVKNAKRDKISGNILEPSGRFGCTTGLILLDSRPFFLPPPHPKRKPLW